MRILSLAGIALVGTFSRLQARSELGPPMDRDGNYGEDTYLADDPYAAQSVDEGAGYTTLDSAITDADGGYIKKRSNVSTGVAIGSSVGVVGLAAGCAVLGTLWHKEKTKPAPPPPSNERSEEDDQQIKDLTASIDTLKHSLAESQTATATTQGQLQELVAKDKALSHMIRTVLKNKPNDLALQGLDAWATQPQNLDLKHKNYKPFRQGWTEAFEIYEKNRSTQEMAVQPVGRDEPRGAPSAK